mgnify:CR=1 FL=1
MAQTRRRRAKFRSGELAQTAVLAVLAVAAAAAAGCYMAPDSASPLPCSPPPRPSPASLSHVHGLRRFTRIHRVALEWDALMYSVTVGWGRKRAVKTILDGLGGHAAPGQLLAVMGPTGKAGAGRQGCKHNQV